MNVSATPRTKADMWQIWFDVIAGDVGNLYIHRCVFNGVRKLVKRNRAIQKPSMFYSCLATSYVHYALMSVRRQIKKGDDSVSLLRLLADIESAPQVLSRHWFRSLYEAEDVESADANFDGFAGQGREHISAAMVRKDIRALKKTGARLESFIDKRIAHNDKRPPKIIPCFRDLDGCINALFALVNKYGMLLRGTPKQFPESLGDWTAIFRHPWIPAETGEGGQT